MAIRVERVVFLSLLLDLFAFTIPLPLFPRIIEWYTVRESTYPNGFLARTLHLVSGTRNFLSRTPAKNPQKWDIVLLGGFMGSIFSALQFFVSPHIGSFSDKYGRKRVLLVTMLGNILSAVVWIKSTTFASYMLSRVIGGLSEGNVQLAIAILSDVTTPADRSKALASVGIAFAICFCVGPPIGAYFASRPFPPNIIQGLELNIYATPAAITLVLLVLETIFLAAALPETRFTQEQGESAEFDPSGDTVTSPAGSRSVQLRGKSIQDRLQLLKSLSTLHFLFLGIFSGVEFTLTFLTFDLFDWNNKQNGTLIGSIGILSALLQGGYVRRVIPKVGEGVIARRGVLSCSIALLLLSAVPHLIQPQNTSNIAVRVLQLAAVFMAYTSATVVNSLTSYASLQCDDMTEAKDRVTGKPKGNRHPDLAKGKALGGFRSRGQLGRAIGPLLACASYWSLGPSATYLAGALAMLILSLKMGSLIRTVIDSIKD